MKRLANRAANTRIHAAIQEAIALEDEALLRAALNKAYKNTIDKSYTSLIGQLLTATWHNEHEDLVNTIYLQNLNDDVFTDSLYKIATEPDVYRKYDDKIESTLRKCVHALKMINSVAANIYLEKLKSTQNDNVATTLAMYNT